MRPLGQLRTPSPVRTKVWGTETHQARTGLSRETGVVIEVLIGMLRVRHTEFCGPLITANPAPGAHERFFERRKLLCNAHGMGDRALRLDVREPRKRGGRFPRPGSATRRHLLDFLIPRQVRRAMGPDVPGGPLPARSSTAAARYDTGVCPSRARGGSYPTVRPSRTHAPGPP